MKRVVCPDSFRFCNDKVYRVVHSTVTSSTSSEDLPTVGRLLRLRGAAHIVWGRRA